jgi:hypothetical protein
MSLNHYVGRERLNGFLGDVRNYLDLVSRVGTQIEPVPDCLATDG